MTGTDQKIRTPAARSRSGPVRFELIDKDGIPINANGGIRFFVSATDAAAYARKLWPDQSQDEDRTGRGWDIQVMGADR
ncbi:MULTISPECIES: hypothetical protein [unclassified Bradyrhizobium]|nr:MULTISPECIES: hypothetical protein [unclassified Bradyrhizobium]